jgi:glutathione S-transferase
MRRPEGREAMAEPIVHGPVYSTYTRTVRLALKEKGAPYKLEEVDVLKGEGQQPAHLARQPFGKVPAFSHDGMTMYETSAITHYVDDVVPGPKLQPSDAKTRARMNQMMSIVDSYAYPSMISVVFQRVVNPLLGAPVDEKAVADAKPKAEKSLAALETLADGNGPFLCGKDLSLADLYLAPLMEYFSATPEGKAALSKSPRVQRWLAQISNRPSVVKTRPKLG